MSWWTLQHRRKQVHYFAVSAIVNDYRFIRSDRRSFRAKYAAVERPREIGMSSEINFSRVFGIVVKTSSILRRVKGDNCIDATNSFGDLVSHISPKTVTHQIQQAG